MLPFTVTGVSKFDVNLETKQVFVETELPSEKILEVLKKTGKATTYVGTAWFFDLMLSLTI